MSRVEGTISEQVNKFTPQKLLIAMGVLIAAAILAPSPSQESIQKVKELQAAVQLPAYDHSMGPR